MFSASILHQVSRVTRGRRYVFLTFLFDEDAERLRQANSEGRAGGNASLRLSRANSLGRFASSRVTVPAGGAFLHERDVVALDRGYHREERGDESIHPKAIHGD